jgi:hypothetical protein
LRALRDCYGTTLLAPRDERLMNITKGLPTT